MRNILRYVGNMSYTDIGKYVDTDCEIYVEPFAGSFGAGFNLMEKRLFKKTVLNYKDYFVYNFWYCIKYDSDKVIKYIKKLYNELCNIEYEQAMNELNKYRESDDRFIQAAYEYLYMHNKDMFGHHDSTIKTLNIDVDTFTDASIRLLDTDIQNKDYSEIIDIYDSSNTFFMMDPPYDVKEINKYYRGNCKEFDHEQLRDKVNSIKGKWLLRYNDNEYIRELYKDNKLILETTRSLFSRKYKEVYYTNI